MLWSVLCEWWQVEEACYFRRCFADFQELFSTGEGDHGEIAGGAVQEDGFNDTEGAGGGGLQMA